MPIAAIPEYMGRDFCKASPAMRFGMYLKLWEHDWKKHNDKQKALGGAIQLNPKDRDTIKAYAARQKRLFAQIGADGLQLAPISVAPFTTGLGNEHPLENGFAFLNPYGLPYLPGSGVKGVLRRAAEELAHKAFFKDGHWTLPAIWHLFGFEPWPRPKGDELEARHDEWVNGFALDPSDVEKYLNALGTHPTISSIKKKILSSPNPFQKLMHEQRLHVRGALQFWDVMPLPRPVPSSISTGGCLEVEVMTPHYSHYYRERGPDSGQSPHDSGKPNPILFLTVPPGSSFRFHVVCDRKRLRHTAPELAKDSAWKDLLKRAFEHAYQWLGFGAKSAVGYGAMKRDLEAEEQSREERDEREQTECARAKRAQVEKERKEREERRLAALTPIEREIEEVIHSQQDKGMTKIVAVMQAVRRDRWDGNAKVEVAKWLEKEMKAERRWRETSEKKRPGKDKDYQNTLTVKSWLKGK